MKYFLAILIMLKGMTIGAQQLSSEKRQYTIENTIEVEVVTKADCNQCYYYLPTNLNISMNDNEPEISLIKWEKDGETEAGAILHFLVRWELSKVQQLEIQNQIELVNKEEAVIMGPVSVEAIPTDDFFYGEHELVEILNLRLQHKPAIATNPGAKMAFSFRFSDRGIEALEDYLKNINSHNAKLKLYYNYKVGSQNQQIELALPLKKILVYLK